MPPSGADCRAMVPTGIGFLFFHGLCTTSLYRRHIYSRAWSASRTYRFYVEPRLLLLGRGGRDGQVDGGAREQVCVHHAADAPGPPPLLPAPRLCTHPTGRSPRQTGRQSVRGAARTRTLSPSPCGVSWVGAERLAWPCASSSRCKLFSSGTVAACHMAFISAVRPHGEAHNRGQRTRAPAHCVHRIVPSSTGIRMSLSL